MEIGQVCVKIAGRDTGKRCVIVDKIDDNHVLIDGEARRRKCNLKHIEPLGQSVEIKKGASHEEVKKALKAMGIEVVDSKPKQKTEKPRKKRKEKVVEKATDGMKKTQEKTKKEEKPAKEEAKPKQGKARK